MPERRYKRFSLFFLCIDKDEEIGYYSNMKVRFGRERETI